MSLIVTLHDHLGPNAQEGGTWTDISVLTPSPSAPVSWNAAIDFTGFASGTYAYEYTVENTTATESDTKVITVELITPPPRTNDVCGSSNPLTWGETFGASALSVNTASNCPRQAGPTDSGVSLPSSWSSAFTSVGVSPPAQDLWYKCIVTPSGGVDPVIIVTVDGVPFGQDAANTPMVALYSGTCDTLAELSHAAAANGIVAQTPPVQVLTSGSPTEIYIRVASAFEGIFNVNISPNLNL